MNSKLTIEPLGILSIPEVNTFLKSFTNEETHTVELRNILATGGIILASRDITTGNLLVCLVVELRGTHIGIGHIYSTKEYRGKLLVNFLKQCQQWGRENTELKYIFNYTCDRKVKLLMKYIGASPLGIYRNHTVFRQTIRGNI